MQSESPSREVDVVNTGGEAALTEAPWIEGSAAGEFKIVGSNCGKLFSGEHCTIWVSFAPGAEAGEKEATLLLPSSNAPTASLVLQGTAVPPLLGFSPGPVEFGLIRANEWVSTGVQLTNEGEGTAHVDWFDFAGPDSTSFGNGSNNCGGASLEPGQSCFIEVWFNPHERRGYEASLTAHSGGQAFSAELSGTGGSAELAPATNPIGFGSTTAGSYGSIQAIELTNVGNMEGGYFIAVVAGGNAASFQLLDETCTGLPIGPGGTCVAHVRFVPQSPGPKSARLALFGDSEGGTLVELRGEGLAAAATLTPTRLDFGSLAPGSRGAARSFVLRNEGAGPLEVAAASIVGTDPDQFALAGDGCTDATLAPGEQCAVRVRFAPDSVGAKSARLRIATAGGQLSADLSGLGARASSQAEGKRKGRSATAKHRRHRRPRFVRNATLSAARAIR